MPVYREMLADMETPVSVLQRFADRENAFLLESMEGGETWGRYSFVGVDPELLLEVDHAGGRTGGLEALREVYRGLRVAEMPGLPRFFGGAVGFIGYEAIGEFERMPRPSRRLGGVAPRSRFLKADRIIVFDNVRHTVKIVVCTRPRPAASPRRAPTARPRRRIEAIAGRAGRPAPAAARPALPAGGVPLEHDARGSSPAMVRRAKEYIVRRRHHPGRAQPAVQRATATCRRSSSTARCAC